MEMLCAQCGDVKENPEKYRYCNSCFDKWWRDHLKESRGEMTKEEYKGKWK